MAYAKPQILSLYRQFLRNSSKFENYNFREYFIRKSKTEFRANKDLKDNTSVFQSALKDLQVLKRQATISKMYQFDKLVVEKLDKHVS